jgi:tRNA pseudouridine65 synthase
MKIEASDILYKDPYLVVVNKPHGLATHPSPGCSDDTTCLRELRRLVGQWTYPVHRLDRATSGALVFALDAKTARLISESFVASQVVKDYIAVVRGHIPPQGIIDKPLPSLSSGTLRAAITHFSCEALTEQPWAVRPFPSARYSLVRLMPISGRTHQLRRHLCSIDHRRYPIWRRRS